jgi:hypothetical protein
MAWGQCLAHRGAAEPYLPLLDALGRLCREPRGEAWVELLNQRAPAWLVQMPWLVPEAALAALEQRVVGVTRERMLREIGEALKFVTAQRPLVLILEDLHWSDPATLDLLSWLARRPEPARLLVIGTYRTGDPLASEHPLREVVQELRIRGLCVALAAEAAYRRARELAEQLNASPGLSTLLYRQATLREFRGQYAESHALLDQREDTRSLTARQQRRWKAGHSPRWVSPSRALGSSSAAWPAARRRRR